MAVETPSKNLVVDQCITFSQTLTSRGGSDALSMTGMTAARLPVHVAATPGAAFSCAVKGLGLSTTLADVCDPEPV